MPRGKKWPDEATRREETRKLRAQWYRRNKAKHIAGTQKARVARRLKVAGRPPGDRCEVCGTTFSTTLTPHFDHNHLTGAFRGWLCAPCNKGIGHLMDSPDVLRKALRYLLDRGHYGPNEEA